MSHRTLLTWALLCALAGVVQAAEPVAAAAPAAPAAPAETTAVPFSFLVYGDSRSNDTCTGNATHLGLINRMSNETASLAFHTGDMITGYTNTTNWVQNGACTSPTSYGSFLNLVAPLRNHALAPGLPMFLYPVVGNHDDAWGDQWYPDPYGNGFCSVFNPQLFVPNHTTKSYFHPNNDNAPVIPDAQFYSQACSLTSRDVYSTYLYYSFDFQNSHFLVLRINNDITDLTGQCNACGGDLTNYSDYYQVHQLDFLKYDLAQAKANPAIKNIFVLLHAPVFTTCDSHPQNPSWQVLTKEFTKYGVTAVFSGHCHVYERTVPIVVDTAHPTGVQDNQLGTVYVTSGGGGSPLNGFNGGPAWFDAVRSVTNHYLRVNVNGQTTTVTVLDANGVQIDSFTRTSGTSCGTNAECQDGNACNGAETCVAGSCQPGTNLVCNDGSACTTDSCIPATGCSYVAVSCDDANACTTDACAPASGCTHQTTSCNDNSACTTDSCVPATGCVYTPITCNDSSACTTNSCVPATGCVFTPITCNDNSACTTDSCAPATGCVYTPISCNDGSACTTDTCAPATGCVHTTISCNDGSACTVDGCDAALGCTHTAAGCDDGNACTADGCSDAAGCTHTAISCNDGNACTTDACAPATGCTHQTTSCDDGNTCTTDACAPATGCTHQATSCDDGNACTTDACSPATGCTHQTASCDDGNACTTDACAPGTGCTHQAASCADGNACTTDSCNPASGCIFVNNSAPCNDGNLCTTNDACVAGACAGGTPAACNDGNVCTIDGCNPASGCVFTNNSAACNDGNTCTDDACNPASGCIFVNNTAPCNDGNACTAGDTCAAGVCVPGGAAVEGLSALATCFDGMDNDCDGTIDLDCAVDAAAGGQVLNNGSVTSGSLASLLAVSPNQSYETIVETGAPNAKVNVVWTFAMGSVPQGTLCELRVEGFRNAGGNDTFPFAYAKRSTTAACVTGESWVSTVLTLQKTSDDNQLQVGNLGPVDATYCIRAKDNKTSSDAALDTLTLDRVFIFPSPVAVSDYPTAADKGTPLAGTTFKATHTSNDAYQSYQEASSGGFSRLVHTWKFTNVPAGSSHRLQFEGNRTQTTSDKDNFQFYWSVTDPSASSSETAGFTQINNAVIKNTSDLSGGDDASFGGSGLQGTVYIRVIDTRTTSGTVLDTLNLDHLAIKTVP